MQRTIVSLDGWLLKPFKVQHDSLESVALDDAEALGPFLTLAVNTTLHFDEVVAEYCPIILFQHQVLLITEEFWYEQLRIATHLEGEALYTVLPEGVSDG